MIRLIIFARYPTPGQAKTRLIPALGPAGAARLQHAMTQYTLGLARHLRERDPSVQVELRYTGAAPEQVSGLYGGDLMLTDQGPGDLGQRMLQAVRDALDAGRVPVLVGSDCPDLDIATLSTACREIERSDLVLGPADDGGYYLVALRRAEPSLFAGIPWGTHQVLQRTLAAARRAGLGYTLLHELRDVDEPGDLPHARPML